MNKIIIHLRDLKLQSQNNSAVNTCNISFLDSVDCPELLIKAQADLLAISERLRSKKLKNRMAQAFGSIGVNSLNNVLDNICYRLLSNNVALYNSWSGRKKPKSSLEDTNFTTLIKNSVRVSHPNATDQEIRTLGSRWFSQANNRLVRGKRENYFHGSHKAEINFITDNKF
ncbi:uncharacterized protein LOC117173351 [Belonocnema kinseyi]|uniref:uncharacterized protein LOC117173351 n=1 Tax=Belonocnema kinseyi TaxID=2817044 RepID=UPI00143D3978|nr:uncharacterized protein LOC117173351 [Belonocnema kinseyi]XP_033217742.1 uncharacterized protein LOC117173351 [Belonocnema kinseyi]XP_033217743.1 uncharacterized protein LOC117173351 [Belonocnema kinseyi]XP_033217744.1 uncharacterized protein LOC117173351 [Belonocnema kinseyi]